MFRQNAAKNAQFTVFILNRSFRSNSGSMAIISLYLRLARAVISAAAFLSKPRTAIIFFWNDFWNSRRIPSGIPKYFMCYASPVKQALFLIRFLRHSFDLVARGTDGGAQGVFVNAAVRKDNGLSLTVGGRDLLHRERPAYRIVHMALAHSAHHPIHCYGNFCHCHPLFPLHYFTSSAGIITVNPAANPVKTGYTAV